MPVLALPLRECTFEYLPARDCPPLDTSSDMPVNESCTLVSSILRTRFLFALNWLLTCMNFKALLLTSEAFFGEESLFSRFDRAFAWLLSWPLSLKLCDSLIWKPRCDFSCGTMDLVFSLWFRDGLRERCWLAVGRCPGIMSPRLFALYSRWCFRSATIRIILFF